MLKVGVTGGIGSGKSTVCRIFESLGYQCYYADARAKHIMVHDETLVRGIKELFGNEAYFENGDLNRKFLGNIVFNDSEKLSQLNGIVHPATGRDYLSWLEAIPSSYSKDFVLKEAAILFESGAYKLEDKVICVHAPKRMRIERVMKRDGVSKEEVLARMGKQWPSEKKMKLSDFVIYNDQSQSLSKQVVAVIQKIKESVSQADR